MKNSKILKLILMIAGLIGMGVGGAILFVPVAFHATTGIALGSDASLLSEIRAPGGALLVFGMLIITGAFVANLRLIATLVAAMLYISYGFSRILSMVIDGMPDTGLVQVTVLEIVIGLVCCFALIKYRESHYE